MRFGMCNEFCQGWSLDEIFALAKKTGYQGVELAPFTLGTSVEHITDETKAQVREASSKHGVEVIGLHWLLAKTHGLHITTSDEKVRERTVAYLKQLVALCHELGGTRMIFGSPLQRNIAEGDDADAARERAIDVFKAILPDLEGTDIVFCLEPLARTETNFITNKDEAVAIIDEIGHPQFQLILDCKAMSDEDKAMPQIIREARPHLKHFHFNDDSKSYPGTGSLDFEAILKALAEIEYNDWGSLEVFDFNPPPEEIAEKGLAHLRANMTKAAPA